MKTMLLTLSLLALTTSAEAQVTLPTKVYQASAAADWATTVYGMQQGFKEGNPMYRWAPPAGAVALGMTVDVLTVYAVNRWVAPKHPRLATIGLLVGSAVRIHAAERNLQVVNGR